MENKKQKICCRLLAMSIGLVYLWFGILKFFPHLSPAEDLRITSYNVCYTKLLRNETCAVIVETIQGIGGLDESTTAFYKGIDALCKKHETMFIADEIQCGYGRTGDFFAFQKHGVTPDIISMAKGMGNGFPVGGILIHPDIKASFGLLGTTFGGNHLACAAALAVLEVLEEESLLQNVKEVSTYFIGKAKTFSKIRKVKGRGLMFV